MALALVGSAALTPQTNSSGGNVTINLPSGITAGKLLFITGLESNGKSLTMTGTWNFQGGGTGPQRWFIWKITDGSEGSTVTFAINGDGSTTFQAIAQLVSGQHASTPVGTLVTGQEASENPYTHATNTITRTGDSTGWFVNWWGATNANRTISGSVDADQDLIGTTSSGVTDGNLHAAYEDNIGTGNAAYSTTMSGTRDWYTADIEILAAPSDTPVSQTGGPGTENLKGITQSTGSGTEDLQGLAATKTESVENLLGLVGSRIELTENLTGLAPTKSPSSESLTGLAPTKTPGSESLTGLTPSKTVSSEYLKKLQPSVMALVENLLGGSISVDLGSESLKGLGSSPVINTENAGTILVSKSLAVPVEWLGGVQRTPNGYSENLAALTKAVQSSSESLVGLARSLQVSTERLTMLTVAVPTNTESALALARALMAASEVLGRPVAFYEVPVEWRRGGVRDLIVFKFSVTLAHLLALDVSLRPHED